MVNKASFMGVGEVFFGEGVGGPAMNIPFPQALKHDVFLERRCWWVGVFPLNRLEVPVNLTYDLIYIYMIWYMFIYIYHITICLHYQFTDHHK